MYFKIVLLMVFAAQAVAGAVAAARQLPDETVVVTANASPVAFENLSRAVVVFDREDIDSLPVRTIEDVLAQSAAIDIRSRSPYGVQSDLSVRGSDYSQVLVLVNGMRINDSQTGHHNSDFPVPLQAVERIEVLLGTGSSIFGADALGGTINIITRHPAERASGSIEWGQYGLVDGALSTYVEKGRYKQSFSVSGNRSSGFADDRDFNSAEVSSLLTIGGNTSFFMSHVRKEFGAYGFYGPAPSREWTNQTFISAERNFEGKAGRKTVVKGFYRTHGDRFIYDVHAPVLFENRHRTHSTGGQLKGQFAVRNTGLLMLGGEFGGDWIDSSNLGDHAYSRTSLFSEFHWTPEKSAALYPGLRFDYYSNFGTAVSPSLSGSWWMAPRLRLRSSVGRAFRIPTFTELYYRDPNHEADSGLKPESAWSVDAGFEYLPADNWLGTFTVFNRWERNVIDWVRSSDAEKWRTSNIRKLRTVGFEAGLERSLSSQARLASHYSYISSSTDSIDVISKYALDFARHSWTLSGSSALPFQMTYKQTLNFRYRADGRSYWLLDGCLEKGFPGFAVALDFTNLLDSRYQEVLGVDMPGRWFVVSVRMK